MEHRTIEDCPQNPVTLEGAAEVKMRMLIGPDQGAPTFHMRHFEVAPGGHTPHHQHNYEHEVLILGGTGIVRSEQGDRAFKSGDVIFVPANEMHQFVNNADAPCSFICLVPAPQSCTS